MLLIPAIDLKDGKCVRLRQGRMDEDTVFSTDPVALAERWFTMGAQRLHLVDLNGAFKGKPVNSKIVKNIADSYPDFPIQIGGGIRDIQTIESYLDHGVRYCILGTIALRDPEFIKDACEAFPGHIIVGIDAKEGRVAVEGWAEISDILAVDLAKEFEDAGVSALVYTDIARDGMMQGVNAEQTATLAEAISLPVIASGGITNMDDIRRLIKVKDSGISGAITGRAIYEGTLDFVEAQKLMNPA